MDAEPDLLIGGQRVEMNLAIIAQSIQVIEKRGAAVPVAELKGRADTARIRRRNDLCNSRP